MSGKRTKALREIMRERLLQHPPKVMQQMTSYHNIGGTLMSPYRAGFRRAKRDWTRRSHAQRLQLQEHGAKEAKLARTEV